MTLISECQFCPKTCCPENKTTKNRVPLGLILEMKGFTQYWLSRKTGLTATAISLIVNGKREPKISTAQKIADALKVPINTIKFGGTL